MNAGGLGVDLLVGERERYSACSLYQALTLCQHFDPSTCVISLNITVVSQTSLIVLSQFITFKYPGYP